MVAVPIAFPSDGAAEVDARQEPLPARGLLTVASLFWVWATVTDIAYHLAMRMEIAAITHFQVFFPWQYRALQHALMLPVLLVCYSTATRIGWRPLSSRVPQQLALAVAFSLSMYLGILVSGHFLHTYFGFRPDPVRNLNSSDFAMWAASGAMHLITYGFGLALITVIAVQRGYHQLQLQNSELRRDWAGARLAVLRAQLSPHTLFNVLHTIQARISDQPETAETLIASLGALLRRLHEAGDRDFARLRDELQFVEEYLSLQKGRFADRLTVELKINKDVPAVWVPSLILQPLVENAVVHGLANHRGPVWVHVTYELLPYGLQLRIENSKGPDCAQADGGSGIQNVRERLEVQFGESATLTSGPENNSRWVATVTLPVLREWGSAPEVDPLFERICQRV